MTAVEPPPTPTIPTPSLVTGLRVAMYVLFFAGLANFVFVAALQLPSLFIAGPVVLGVGLVCYGVAAYLSSKSTIVGASGKRYPRFKILNYLTPAEMLRVRLQDWEIVRSGVTHAAVRTHENGWRTTCPLAAALGTFQGCPGPGAITDVIYNAKYGVVTDSRLSAYPTADVRWCEIHEAVEEFLAWADEGHINPVDMEDIFNPRYAALSPAEKQYAYERRHDA